MFQRARDLSDDLRAQACQLIFDSFPQYYAVPGVDHAVLLSAIDAQLLTKGSETNNAQALLQDGTVVGVFAGIGSEALKAAQMISTQAIMKALDKEANKAFRQHIRSFAGALGQVPEPSWYLSRIAVSSIARQQGLGRKLLDAFAAERDEALPGAPLSLHLHQDNTAALAFYQKCGFEVFDGEATFPTLRRA